MRQTSRRRRLTLHTGLAWGLALGVLPALASSAAASVPANWSGKITVHQDHSWSSGNTVEKNISDTTVTLQPGAIKTGTNSYAVPATWTQTKTWSNYAPDCGFYPNTSIPATQNIAGTATFTGTLTLDIYWNTTNTYQLGIEDTGTQPGSPGYNLPYAGTDCTGARVSDYYMNAGDGLASGEGTASPTTLDLVRPPHQSEFSFGFTEIWSWAIHRGAACALPSAPATIAATPQAGTATVTWSPPASNGGCPIAFYTITWNGGSEVVAATQTTATVPALIEGRVYSVSVAATTAAGSGPPVTSAPFTAIAATTGTCDTSTYIPPNALDDAVEVPAGRLSQIRVLANDSAAGGSLTFTTGPALHGTASPSGASVYYQPDPGFVGTDSFMYSFTDSCGNSSTATVTVVVRARQPLVLSAETAQLVQRLGPNDVSLVGADAAAAVGAPSATGLVQRITLTESWKLTVDMSQTPTSAPILFDDQYQQPDNGWNLVNPPSLNRTYPASLTFTFQRTTECDSVSVCVIDNGTSPDLAIGVAGPITTVKHTLAATFDIAGYTPVTLKVSKSTSEGFLRGLSKKLLLV